MYQSIYYDRTTYEYHLRDDVKGWKTFKYQPTLYQLDPDGEFTTLEGQSVSPTENGWMPNPNYDKNLKDNTDNKNPKNIKNPKIFENDVDGDTRVLVDFYYESDDTPSYHNLVYLDIECEIAGALTPENIKDPKGKITSIALYDNNSKKYYCLILDEKKLMSEAKSESKEIIPYKTEKELLNGFLDIWIKLDPTIIAGWNSEFFDIPYLYYRISKVLSKEIAQYLSPIQKIKEESNKSLKGNYDETIILGGINHLDYMKLFKKFITKQESSYALGNIGEKYVNLGKIEYQGSLDKLFIDDIDKFIEYNIRDVEIIVELEKALKFIELSITICHLCHTAYKTIYYSTKLNEGAILTYLKRKSIVSPNKPTTYNPSLHHLQEEYAGGYLKDPTPGLYEWVIDLDFTSLYPSIIRSLNMGVETLVGRVVNDDKFDNQWSLKELKAMDPNKTVTIEKVKKDRRLSEAQISVGNLIEIIEKNDFIISAPGVMFRKDKLSIVCEILSDWFTKRQEYKALMKKAYKVDNDPVMGEFYNKRQHAYKIKLNDVYGVFAINGWRYTDGHKFISKAITLTGQRLLQESIANMNTYLNNELSNETPVDYIVTSDTDSLFIQCKDLLKARHPDIDFNNQEDVIKKILVIATELQAMANKFIGEFARDAFNLGEDTEHYFELKQEVVLDRGYFAGKRRYAIHIINKEGVPTDELDVKGLDLMKSNFPPLFKKFGEHIINEIMFGKSKNDIDKQILDFRNEIRTIGWKHILKPTGLKKMGEYLAGPPTAGEIFSKIKLKCPINTKAAIYTNDILRFKKLDKKYPTFQIGDKIYLVYLKDNPYRIDAIALNGYNDAPELLEFAEKYIDRDGLFDSVMKNKLESLYSDLGWGAVVLNPNINKFFKF